MVSSSGVWKQEKNDVNRVIVDHDSCDEFYQYLSLCHSPSIDHLHSRFLFRRRIKCVSGGN